MIRARHAETVFAQLTIIISLLLGPFTTAIIITMLSPEDQGQYYVLTALGALIGVLHLGDLEAAIAGVDRTNTASFEAAALGLMFWRLMAMLFTFLILLFIAYFTSVLGNSARQLKLSAIYFAFITTNSLVAAPHQLSQALSAPYWRRRFYEYATYSVVLMLGLYCVRDTTALIVAAGASVLANLLFSAKICALTGFLRSRGTVSPLNAMGYWQAQILPKQRSVGLAHIYSQIGYRVLVPAASESLGMVFAGKVGATLSVLGFALGLLQQRLRVLYPKLARMQSRAGNARSLTIRRLKNKASFKIGLGVISAGAALSVALVLLSQNVAWIKDRFLSSIEILVLAFILSIIGIIGVNAIFRFAAITVRALDLWLFIAIAITVALPMLIAGFIGALGFWIGAIIGPTLMLAILSKCAFVPKVRVF